ncbi:MAG: isoprenylcysteine carboxylmethyltransferase family protein [Hyphomicrobiales bacterium]|nr:isoprenylcysteine carboxylmethyltransferase family protein [Hyphomicrobiales bacterium]
MTQSPPQQSDKRQTWRSRLADIAAASPVLLWCVFGLGGSVYALQNRLDAGDGLMLATRIANMAFLAALVFFILLRRPPHAKGEGLAPRLSGAAGFAAPMLLLLVAPAVPLAPLPLVAALLSCLGATGALFVLLWLGRAFAITPQARGLVTGGPYRYARHPLYAAELALVAGAALMSQQPWGALIFALSAAMQFVRMAYEEKVLARAYPQYAEYARRTARLIPGVY